MKLGMNHAYEIHLYENVHTHRVICAVTSIPPVNCISLSVYIASLCGTLRALEFQFSYCAGRAEGTE